MVEFEGKKIKRQNDKGVEGNRTDPRDEPRNVYLQKYRRNCNNNERFGFQTGTSATEQIFTSNEISMKLKLLKRNRNKIEKKNTKPEFQTRKSWRKKYGGF